MRSALRQLGLSEKESHLYLALLSLDNANPTLLSQKTGINRVTVYPVLESLLKRGLVSRFKRKNKWHYAIEDPRRFKELEQEKSARIDKMIPQLMALYHTSGLKPEVRFYEGQEGLNTLFFDSLRQNPSKEILFLYPAWDILDLFGKEEVELYVKQRVEKGILSKAIRQQGKEVSLEKYPYLGSGPQVLREVRLAPKDCEFSVVNAIYGDRIAFFASKKENGGLLIISPSLAQLMRMYFLNLWNQCSPLK